MKAKECLTALSQAYFNLIDSLDEPIEKKIVGMSKVAKVFEKQTSKSVVIELINLLLQPSDEELLIKNVWDPLPKGDSHKIKFHINHGMGLKVPLDEQIEIIEFINSAEMRAKDFSFAFAKKIKEKVKILSKK